MSSDADEIPIRLSVARGDMGKENKEERYQTDTGDFLDVSLRNSFVSQMSRANEEDLAS